MSLNNLPFAYVSVDEIADALNGTGYMTTSFHMCGFFLCQKGSADVSINDRMYHIQSGDIYYYTPSTFLYVASHSDDLEGIGVKCSFDFVLPLLEKVVDGKHVLRMRENPRVTLTPEQQADVEQLIDTLRTRQRLLKEVSPSDTGYGALEHLVLSLAGSIFHELIYLYAISHQIDSKPTDTHDRIFNAFIFSLFKNYKQKREVSYYAEEQCLSPRYFSSVIKEKSGRSALQWIAQMVISSMRQRLRDTDLTIKELSMEFNFPSQSFFGKYFKQYVGTSPKVFRLRERGEI